ncbi:unnamed protein product [Brassica napus]|uniref:Uncharacterized protein n=2 Tax=Brassica TaxID=3705 RepID=A0A3P6C331_BRAOL|nr:unnamed protein product [Brassica napus]VDD08768.1 unnamed protein product [Brassica oleracea]
MKLLLLRKQRSTDRRHLETTTCMMSSMLTCLRLIPHPAYISLLVGQHLSGLPHEHPMDSMKTTFPARFPSILSMGMHLDGSINCN